MATRLGGNRAANTRTLKTLLAARRRRAVALEGSIGGIVKRHDDMVNIAAEMRVLLREVSEMTSGGLEHPAFASTKITKDLHTLVSRMLPILVGEEEANKRAAESVRDVAKQLRSFRDDTMAEVNDIARAVTEAHRELHRTQPLRPGTESVDPERRVHTTMFRLTQKHTFETPAHTIFARRRGSAPRRSNLPGKAQSIERANDGVSGVPPEPEEL